MSEEEIVSDYPSLHPNAANEGSLPPVRQNREATHALSN
jgi:hypothetical protein